MSRLGGAPAGPTTWKLPVESAELLISDPCYVRSSRDDATAAMHLDGNLGARVAVIGGKALATCAVVRRRIWPGEGGTVSGLAIQFVRPRPGCTREHIKAVIGVDSGQVLVGDPRVLARLSERLKYEDLMVGPDNSPFLVRAPAGAAESGAVALVAPTKDGDGEYDLWLTRNAAGEVVDLFVDFETLWHDGAED